jgi:hypothetical protein
MVAVILFSFLRRRKSLLKSVTDGGGGGPIPNFGRHVTYTAGKAKVKLPLYLIRQHALKTYGSAAVQLHAFFASPLYVTDE